MNRSRAKGTQFESEVVAFLNEHGFPDAERRALHGSKDRGDVAGVRGWVMSAKNCKQMSLGPWMTEAAKQAAHAGVTRYVVVHKRRQHGTGDAYATVPLWLLCDLLTGGD